MDPEELDDEDDDERAAALTAWRCASEVEMGFLLLRFGAPGCLGSAFLRGALWAGFFAGLALGLAAAALGFALLFFNTILFIAFFFRWESCFCCFAAASVFAMASIRPAGTQRDAQVM